MTINYDANLDLGYNDEKERDIMIRHINKNDLDLLIQIDLDDEGYTVDDQEMSETERLEHREKINSFIIEDDRGGFIYEIDHTPVGVLMYSVENCDKDYPWPTPYKDILRHHFSKDCQLLAVFQLWVDPSHRRKRIAYDLKVRLEEQACLLNIKTLYTHTESQNQHVIDMNLKLGYAVVRIGPIWDQIFRVSLLKDLRKQTVDNMFKSVSEGHKCLITAEALESQLDDNSVFLLDIRLETDYRIKHLKNSLHSEWDAVHQLIQQNKIPKDKTIVVVCYTGQSSMHIATLLDLKGYNAVSLLDGIKNWPYHHRIEK